MSYRATVRGVCGCTTPDGGAREVGDYGVQLRMGFWLGLLSAGWGFQKSICRLGLPQDCASDSAVFSRAGENWAPGLLADLDGLRQLLVFGFFSGWLNGVWRPQRCAYLFGYRRSDHAANVPSGAWLAGGINAAALLPTPSREIGELDSSAHADPLPAPALLAASASVRGRWCGGCRVPWFLAVYFASIPSFSALTKVSTFQRSIDSNAGSFSGLYAVTLILVLVGGCGMLLGHIIYAWNHCGGGAYADSGGRARAFWFGYFLPRLLVYAFFVMYLALLIPSITRGADDEGNWHLHHWWLAWLLSLWFSFNHPLSALPLAVSTAVFTQGCSAYNVAPLIEEDKCTYFESSSALSCSLKTENITSFDVCFRHGLGQVLCHEL